MTPILEIAGIGKTFPGQVALVDAALTVLPGQVHALVGQNGSGKSTLIKILAGYHRPDVGGTIRLLGKPVTVEELADHRHPIFVMHQDLGLVGSLNAIENLALGRGFHTRAGRIVWREEADRTRSLLEELGTHIDVYAPVDSLTPAERAILALGRALQDWEGTSGLLILDEPTTALPRPEVNRLFAAIRRVAGGGAGVIFVSHRLDEVFEIADHVTVLRDGEVVAGEPAAALDHDRLVEHIVGRPIDQFYAAPPDMGDDVVLDVRGLWGQTVQGVDLALRTGEIVGIAGLDGSGRGEIPGLVYGSAPRFAGEVLVDRKPVPNDPQRAIGCGIGMVPGDRKRLGSIPIRSVRENITLPRLGPFFRGGRLSRRQETQAAREWIERVDLRPPEPEQTLETLSGGNQQKAVVARWLRTVPRVLVLDEPTQGVDVGAKVAIYSLLAAAAADGAAMLVCSSDAEELAHICDRVLVMRDGRVVVELAGDALDESEITRWSLAQDTAVGAA